jgi:hypothetical protein
LNSAGDVIYVPGSTLGNICGVAIPNNLINNWQIPLNGNNFLFSGNGRIGFGNIGTTCNPLNTVEIAQGITPSGLTFTNLNSGSATSPSTGTVLSVNANGDVILVAENTGGTGVGNYCGATPNPLIADYQVPMNDKDYHFTDNGSLSLANNVGIGTTCPLTPPTPLPARLTVINPVMNFGIDATTTSSGFTNAGIRGTGSNALIESYGVVGRAFSTSPVSNHGVAGRARNASQFSYGGLFVADGTIGNNNGVNAKAMSTSTVNTNVGGHFIASGGSIAYGVYCNAPITAPVPPGAPLTLALFADGDANVSGTLYLATPPVFVSDQQFKTNIDTILSAIDIVNQLKPVTFEYNSNYNNQFSVQSGRHYGFIAQEVAQVIPELVSDAIAPAKLDTAGNITVPSLPYKALNYEGIIPILTQAVKEQQKCIHSKDSLIDDLNVRLTSLENCINSLNLCESQSTLQPNNTGNHQMQSIGINVDLKDGQSIVLEQNLPNPFAEQTTISYFLPDHVNKAQILFYNAQGKLIQSTELTEKGKGQLNVFASDLSNGIYTYVLVVDGKIIETKKMVKQ